MPLAHDSAPLARCQIALVQRPAHSSPCIVRAIFTQSRSYPNPTPRPIAHTYSWSPSCRSGWSARASVQFSLVIASMSSKNCCFLPRPIPSPLDTLRSKSCTSGTEPQSAVLLSKWVSVGEGTKGVRPDTHLCSSTHSGRA